MIAFYLILILLAALPIALWAIDRSKVRSRERDRVAGVTRYP